MKKLNLLLVVSLLTIPTLFFLSGCQENQTSSSELKMTKLLAEENSSLEKDLANRDKMILNQMNLLQNCEQEKAEQQQKADESMTFLMQKIVGELKTQVDQLQMENQELKTKLDKIE